MTEEEITKAAKDAWAVYEYRDTPGRLYHSCFEDAFALGARWMQESLQLTLTGTVDAEGNMYDFPPERFMEE